MHILLIHQAFAAVSEPGGTRHHELARALVQKGHKVTIIASPVSYLTGRAETSRKGWRTVDQSEPGITLIRVYTYPALHKSFVHRLVSFFSFMISSFLASMGVKDVDLVWGTSPPIFQAFTAWLTARLKKASFVFEVRDLWPAFAIAIGVLKNKLLIQLSLWLEHFLYSRADTVIVNSPGFLDHVRQKGAKRVELIPNGADPEMFAGAKGKPFFHQAEYRDRFICLYAGAHGVSNDLGVILSAAGLLRDRKEVLFVLVGDGKEKANLQASASEQQLRNVIFLPPVAKEEMVRVIQGANACIAILKPLELYKTTYPNKVFDYMAAGRPVILAIDGVIREVVESSQAGVFSQPGDPKAMADAVLQFLAHPVEADRMGKNGRRYVISHFNRAVISDQLNMVLKTTRERTRDPKLRVDG